MEDRLIGYMSERAKWSLRETLARLAKLYPLNSRISVQMRHGQKTVTQAVVAGHEIEARIADNGADAISGDVYPRVRVKLKNGRYRSIDYTQIVGLVQGVKNESLH